MICCISDSDATEVKIFNTIVGSVLQEFKFHDKDEDKSLGLEEFASFAHWMFDSVSFYKKAFKDQTEEGWDDDVISQTEWECSAEDIADDQCRQHPISKSEDHFKVIWLLYRQFG